MNFLKQLTNWKSAPITTGEIESNQGSKDWLPRQQKLLQPGDNQQIKDLYHKPILRARPKTADQLAQQNGWTIERNEDLKHQLRLDNQELRIYATNLAKYSPQLTAEQHQIMVINYARQQTERRSNKKQ